MSTMYGSATLKDTQVNHALQVSDWVMEETDNLKQSNLKFASTL